MEFKFTCLALAMLLIGLFVVGFRKISAAPFNKNLQVQYLLLCLCAVLAIHFFFLGLVGHVSHEALVSSAVGLLIYQIKHVNFLNQDWLVISEAIDFIAENPNTSIYSTLLTSQSTQFQYPTTTLLFLDFIKSNTVFEWGTIFNVLNYLSILTLPWLTWLCYRLYFRENIHAFVIEQLSDIKKIGVLLIFFCVVLAFYSIMASIYLGQMQIWVVTLIAWSMLCFSDKKYVMAGVLFGICASIQLHWGIILVWAAFRRQWSLMLSGLGVLLLAVLLASYFYGADDMSDYLASTWLLMQTSDTFATHSIGATMLGLINSLIKSVFSGFSAMSPMMSILIMMLVVAITLCWRANKKPNELDLACILMALVPVAWGTFSYDYAALLPVLTVVSFYALKRSRGVGMLSYLLVTWILSSGSLTAFLRLFSEWKVVSDDAVFTGYLMLFYLTFRLTHNTDSQLV